RVGPAGSASTVSASSIRPRSLAAWERSSSSVADSGRIRANRAKLVSAWASRPAATSIWALYARSSGSSRPQPQLIAATTHPSAGENHGCPRFVSLLGASGFDDFISPSHHGPLERADYSGGPSDRHAIDDLGWTQAHQDPRVVRGHEAVSALFLAVDDPA